MVWKTKPVVVEAFRLGIDTMPRWYIEMVADHKAIYYTDAKNQVASHVETPEGWIVASQGDWLVRGPYGAVRVLKNADFISMYEEVVE